jgi:hypothetical protein
MLTGFTPEAPPYSNTEEQRRSNETSDGDPVEAEIQVALASEFLHHQAEDFPLRKESGHA